MIVYLTQWWFSNNTRIAHGIHSSNSSSFFIKNESVVRLDTIKIIIMSRKYVLLCYI